MLKLGLTSFGRQVANLAYFREEFVGRRQWLKEQAYADIVALRQFLPGPSSRQTGIALGFLRGGFLGGLAAWAGFTLPSALALVALLLLIFGKRRPGRRWCWALAASALASRRRTQAGWRN